MGTRTGSRSGDVLVRLDRVSKRYQDGQVVTEVLTDVDMHIERGSFTVVLGVSGCGKTTLLNLVAGLDVPSSGERFKTLTNEDLVRIGGYYRWRRGEMVNSRKQHRTLLEFSNWRIDQGLNDRYFTVRYLERGM